MISCLHGCKIMISSNNPSALRCVIGYGWTHYHCETNLDGLTCTQLSWNVKHFESIINTIHCHPPSWGGYRSRSISSWTKYENYGWCRASMGCKIVMGSNNYSARRWAIGYGWTQIILRHLDGPHAHNSHRKPNIVHPLLILVILWHPTTWSGYQP